MIARTDRRRTIPRTTHPPPPARGPPHTPPGHPLRHAGSPKGGRSAVPRRRLCRRPAGRACMVARDAWRHRNGPHARPHGTRRAVVGASGAKLDLKRYPVGSADTCGRPGQVRVGGSHCHMSFACETCTKIGHQQTGRQGYAKPTLRNHGGSRYAHRAKKHSASR